MKNFGKSFPSRLVQNFLVLLVEVSVWVIDVNDGSGGSKRVVYYHQKYSFRLEKVRSCFQVGNLKII